MVGAMAGRETYYCYACLHRHEADSAIGRSHARFDIEADASTSALQSHIREFYLQTRGVQAALRILGIEGVRIHPPRFGRGWPPKEEVERRLMDATASGAESFIVLVTLKGDRKRLSEVGGVEATRACACSIWNPPYGAFS